MSSIDKVDDFFYQVKKFLLPTLFLIIGCVLLYQALTPDIVTLNNDEQLEVYQGPLFLYSALIFIVVSVIWFLYIFNLIKSIVGYGIMALMLIGAGVVLYKDYQTVKEEVVFKNRYEKIEKEIFTRMQDIEAAEIAFKQSIGTYTDNMDDLIKFVKEGKTMDVIKVGALPARTITPEERDMIYGDNRPIDNLMNEFEAAYIARQQGDTIDGHVFKRDTVYVPVLDAIFYSDNYLDARGKIGGQIAFHPDSLRYVPYSKEEVELDTASVTKGDLKVPTLLIKMTHPMEDPIDGRVAYMIGSLEENHLRKSWDQ